ncbi:MAG: ABC transporter permease [Actinobacteria bacterium]|nr:ABC transporter permease [Actinomycetota bacterium]NCV36583.1 ABC transporter permease [Actinomycetota bacterium]NCV98532.1 ABC transporter permease [Actinomycetota bacterium]NCW23246.1 ABC transporter permease [Actinomycetota bacterium]NCW95494.1 ABC transporter permease [Actinomycetota bacterium]
MQIAKEERVGFKSPITMAGIGALVLVFFGILGREGETVFEISRRVDVIQLPAIPVGSSALGWVAGILLLAIAGYSLSFALKNRKTPLWVSVIYGAIGVVALLGWLAAGNSVPLTFIIGTALVLAVPIMLGAMGGLMCERVGVTNIAIEAQLLTGAFMAAVVSSITDNFFFGLASAMIGGALVSMVLAVFAIKYLAQQIIVGVVLNVLMIGITNFLYQQWLTEDGENVNFPGTLDIIKIPFLSDIPVIGPVIFENRITVFAALIFVPTLYFILFKTKLGLRARAVGEHPLAADTVGINVARTRFWWVTLGGMSAGLGGAALTIGNAGAFGREMAGGFGFIALAVVILGRWHPISAALAALLFGFSIILRVWANQVSPGIPTDFITMVPYLVTIIAVVGFVGQSRPPKALAIPYTKG